jgi:hypothetical protein
MKTLRVAQIRKVITNVKDSKRIGPTASRLLDEVYGDSEQYLSVLHIHDTKLKSTLRSAEDKVIKEAVLSTNRVKQALTLDNNDAAFLKVRAEVDKVMSSSVQEIYGQFSELTTPILTQVSNLFFYMIIKQFKAISHKHLFNIITIRKNYPICPPSSNRKCLYITHF